MKNTKYITINVGLNNLPPSTTARHIMDSIAYSFDTRTFAKANAVGTGKGEVENTYVIMFEADNVPDSTILKRLEGLASVYGQDAIAYLVNTGSNYCAAGLAWSPGVQPEDKYIFDESLFLTVSSGTAQEVYTSENTPPGSTKYKG